MTRVGATLLFTAVLAGVPAGAVAQTAAAPDPRAANLTVYSDLLWSDVRAQKVAVLTELMALTEAEDAAFWPIYRAYDAELAALHEERAANVGQYAASYGSLTDSQADSLGRKAIDINRRRAALLESYYDRVKTAVSAKVALRFLQVEHQLLLLVDLQIASSLPVVK
jgi:hypothetical protein